jgi:hypothetical protein
MSGLRPDMSEKLLWKLAFELNMSGYGDLTWVKAERPDMSELGVGHVRKTSMEP